MGLGAAALVLAAAQVKDSTTHGVYSVLVGACTRVGVTVGVVGCVDGVAKGVVACGDAERETSIAAPAAVDMELDATVPPSVNPPAASIPPYASPPVMA